VSAASAPFVVEVIGQHLVGGAAQRARPITGLFACGEMIVVSLLYQKGRDSRIF
jgi:hypothetical protein